MSGINDLAPLQTVEGSYIAPMYLPNQSTAKRATYSQILDYFRKAFTSQTLIESIHTPTDGFTITVTQDSQNYWMQLKPTGAIASGALVLPAPAYTADGQEILVTTTAQIISFTVNGNGTTNLYGIPMVLAAEDSFRIRYSKLSQSWTKIA